MASFPQEIAETFSHSCLSQHTSAIHLGGTCIAKVPTQEIPVLKGIEAIVPEKQHTCLKKRTSWKSGVFGLLDVGAPVPYYLPSMLPHPYSGSTHFRRVSKFLLHFATWYPFVTGAAKAISTQELICSIRIYEHQFPANGVSQMT